MTDLHPEELLHRAAEGELDAADEALVRAHLRECAACRLELSVRRAAAHHTNRRSGDERTVRRLAGLAVAAASAPTPAQPTARIGSWTGAALGAVVGLLLLVAMSWAYRLGGSALRDSDGSHSQAEATRLPDGPSAAVVERRDETAGRTAEARQSVPSATQGDAPPKPTEGAPEATSAAPQARSTMPGGPRQRTPRPATAPQANRAESSLPAPVEALAPSPPIEGLDAAGLFARGTAASRRGEHVAALDAFAKLRKQFGDTREARTSWVLSARILLAAKEYERALACFDGYLGGGATGPLAPEAMAGRATALDGLGRASAARRQWQALLERFPRSSLSARAKTRLAGEASP